MIFLKNGTFINWQTLEFSQCDILVDEGPMGQIHFNPDKVPDTKIHIIDCSGKYITKSFACGHHHVYSALSRGMNATKKNQKTSLKYCNMSGGRSTRRSTKI